MLCCALRLRQWRWVNPHTAGTCPVGPGNPPEAASVAVGEPPYGWYVPFLGQAVLLHAFVMPALLVADDALANRYSSSRALALWRCSQIPAGPALLEAVSCCY